MASPGAFDPAVSAESADGEAAAADAGAYGDSAAGAGERAAAGDAGAHGDKAVGLEDEAAAEDTDALCDEAGGSQDGVDQPASWPAYALARVWGAGDDVQPSREGCGAAAPTGDDGEGPRTWSSWAYSGAAAAVGLSATGGEGEDPRSCDSDRPGGGLAAPDGGGGDRPRRGTATHDCGDGAGSRTWSAWVYERWWCNGHESGAAGPTWVHDGGSAGDGVGAVTEAAAGGGGREQPAWTMVDDGEAQEIAKESLLRQTESAKKRHEERGRRMEQEDVEAYEAEAKVKRVQEERRGTGAKNVAWLCVSPKSARRIAHVSRDRPPVVTTDQDHGFRNGQAVVIQGVQGASQDDGWAVVNGEHIISHLNSKSFALLGVDTSSLLSDAEVKDAEAGPSVISWTQRQAPSPHLLLYSTARSLYGLQFFASGVFQVVRLASSGLRGVAGMSARLVSASGDSEHDARAVNLESTLRRLEGVSAPDLGEMCENTWQWLVETSQPVWWARASAARVCADCFTAFAADPCGEAGSGAKHHCRNCGEVVCEACSQAREPVPWNGYANPERVCRLCVNLAKQRNLTLKAYADLHEVVHMKVPSAGKGKGKGKGAAPPPPPPRPEAKSAPLRPPRAPKAPPPEPPPETGHPSDGGDGCPTPQTAVAKAHIETFTGMGQLNWSVALKKIKNYLPEIGQCLTEVSLAEAKGADEWVRVLGDLMPLNKFITQEGLDRLGRAAGSPGEVLEGLPKPQRWVCNIICANFLPVSELEERVRLLAALLNADEAKREISPLIDDARKTYGKLLSREVQEFLTTLRQETQKQQLAELAGSDFGAPALVNAVLDIADAFLDNLKPFTKAAAPVPGLEHVRGRLEIERQKRHEVLSLAEKAGGSRDELRRAAAEVGRAVATIEEGFAAALDSGRTMLEALDALPAEFAGDGSGEKLESSMAAQIDACVAHVRKLVERVAAARPKRKQAVERPQIDRSLAGAGVGPSAPRAVGSRARAGASRGEAGVPRVEPPTRPGRWLTGHVRLAETDGRVADVADGDVSAAVAADLPEKEAGGAGEFYDCSE